MNLPTQSATIPKPTRVARRCGLTLIEIMIALVMTLIVLYAMMIAFQYASREISRGRAVLELSNQLRGAIELLRADLDGLTLSPKPYSESEIPHGYFEYVEGPRRDYTGQGIGSVHNYLGDVDDIIAFTTRSTRRPFRGRYRSDNTPETLVESNVAEVVWWTQFDDRNDDNSVDFTETVTLFRRVLLIRPDLPLPQTTPDDLQAAADFFATTDISARWVDTNGDNLRDQMVPNTLNDLAKRENRFVHDPQFPHIFVRLGTAIPSISLTSTKMSGSRLGDDILLTQIAGFDVKIYSRDARVRFQQNVAIPVEPGDIGFSDPNIVFDFERNNGGFVDLAYFTNSFDANDVFGNAFDPARTQFETYPTDKSRLRYLFDPNDNPINPQFGYEVAYCSWYPYYERDGIDQDGDGLVDEGTNGIDDPDDYTGMRINGVDDNNERETMPPYPYAARGVKVTFRLIEKGTRQLRQQSVIHSFVPE